WQDSPLARAERVDNYLGMPGVTGPEMMDQFHSHAESMGVEFVEGRVISLMAWDGYALTVGSDMYQGTTLILAPGVVRQAKYPGEENYLGRGVSYCATCDGMLYRKRPVVVAGLSKDAPQEANYLQEIGCQVTYVSPRQPEGLRADIPFHRGRALVVKGSEKVEALLADEQELPCEGVFILREAVAPNDLLPGLEMENSAIKVDRSMATNLTGVFAAGDCTGAPLQISKAVGEGLVAALSACEYLDKRAREQ
ncbi:MAG: FAD-dependent oxidoreductase, partial [Clostridium sp.]|nr:FAD-dependent oxidoreductase [Clostridium sp.]